MRKHLDVVFETVRGNILSDEIASKVDYIVNPVNKVGVMGKGLAKAFKDKYPDMFNRYKEHCKGYMKYEPTSLNYTTRIYRVDTNLSVICLPTKEHWKDNSTWDLIETSLMDMMMELFYSNMDLKMRPVYGITIAIPKIGCGLGGLDWNEIKPLVVTTIKESYEYIESDSFYVPFLETTVTGIMPMLKVIFVED